VQRFFIFKIIDIDFNSAENLGCKNPGVMDGVLVWIRNEYGMIRIINTGGLIVSFQCITNFGQQPA
jgi:hypothetical protein